jgi:hypothetical protein
VAKVELKPTISPNELSTRKMTSGASAYSAKDKCEAMARKHRLKQGNTIS